ncbi:hypothetical protein TNCV_333131 [Trichonephila clavipes]|nr:hypothetical protein TNCV_333131 [Trichonephila clavipes]
MSSYKRQFILNSSPLYQVMPCALAALRRFIARHGHPSEIHSDNGTNFTGANNYLKQLYASERTLNTKVFYR